MSDINEPLDIGKDAIDKLPANTAEVKAQDVFDKVSHANVDVPDVASEWSKKVSSGDYDAEEINKIKVDRLSTPTNVDIGDYKRLVPLSTPYTNLDEARARAQGPWETWGKGLARAAGTFAQAYVEPYVDMTYGLGAAIVNKDFSKLYDNDITNWMDEMNMWLKEELPIYYTQEEMDADAFSPDNWWKDAFWADKVLNGAAFTAASIVSGMSTKGIGTLASGAGTAVKYSRATQNLLKTAKIATNKSPFALRGIMGVQKATALNSARNYGKYLGTYAASNISAMSEAGMEAREVRNQLKPKLDVLVRDGKITQEEANNRLDRAGNNAFMLNNLIVGMSNHIQFGRYIGKAGSGVKHGGRKPSLSFDKGKFNLKRDLANGKFQKTLNIAKDVTSTASKIGSEVLEEGSQYFITEFNKERFGERNVKNTLEAATKAMDAMSSKEAKENMLIGGLVGLFGGGMHVKQIVNDNANDRKTANDLNQLMLGENSAFSKYMNLVSKGFANNSKTFTALDSDSISDFDSYYDERSALDNREQKTLFDIAAFMSANNLEGVFADNVEAMLEAETEVYEQNENYNKQVDGDFFKNRRAFADELIDRVAGYSAIYKEVKEKYKLFDNTYTDGLYRSMAELSYLQEQYKRAYDDVNYYYLNESYGEMSAKFDEKFKEAKKVVESDAKKAYEKYKEDTAFADRTIDSFDEFKIKYGINQLAMDLVNARIDKELFKLVNTKFKDKAARAGRMMVDKEAKDMNLDHFDVDAIHGLMYVKDVHARMAKLSDTVNFLKTTAGYKQVSKKVKNSATRNAFKSESDLYKADVDSYKARYVNANSVSELENMIAEIDEFNQGLSEIEFAPDFDYNNTYSLDQAKGTAKVMAVHTTIAKLKDIKRMAEEGIENLKNGKPKTGDTAATKAKNKIKDALSRTKESDFEKEGEDVVDTTEEEDTEEYNDLLTKDRPETKDINKNIDSTITKIKNTKSIIREIKDEVDEETKVILEEHNDSLTGLVEELHNIKDSINTELQTISELKETLPLIYKDFNAINDYVRLQKANLNKAYPIAKAPTAEDINEFKSIDTKETVKYIQTEVSAETDGMTDVERADASVNNLLSKLKDEVTTPTKDADDSLLTPTAIAIDDIDYKDTSVFAIMSMLFDKGKFGVYNALVTKLGKGKAEDIYTDKIRLLEYLNKHYDLPNDIRLDIRTYDMLSYGYMSVNAVYNPNYNDIANYLASHEDYIDFIKRLDDNRIMHSGMTRMAELESDVTEPIASIIDSATMVANLDFDEQEQKVTKTGAVKTDYNVVNVGTELTFEIDVDSVGLRHETAEGVGEIKYAELIDHVANGRFDKLDIDVVRAIPVTIKAGGKPIGNMRGYEAAINPDRVSMSNKNMPSKYNNNIQYQKDIQLNLRIAALLAAANGTKLKTKVTTRNNGHLFSVPIPDSDTRAVRNYLVSSKLNDKRIIYGIGKSVENTAAEVYVGKHDVANVDIVGDAPIISGISYALLPANVINGREQYIPVPLRSIKFSKMNQGLAEDSDDNRLGNRMLRTVTEGIDIYVRHLAGLTTEQDEAFIKYIKSSTKGVIVDTEFAEDDNTGIDVTTTAGINAFIKLYTYTYDDAERAAEDDRGLVTIFEQMRGSRSKEVAAAKVSDNFFEVGKMDGIISKVLVVRKTKTGIVAKMVTNEEPFSKGKDISLSEVGDYAKDLLQNAYIRIDLNLLNDKSQSFKMPLVKLEGGRVTGIETNNHKSYLDYAKTVLSTDIAKGVTENGESRFTYNNFISYDQNDVFKQVDTAKREKIAATLKGKTSPSLVSIERIAKVELNEGFDLFNKRNAKNTSEEEDAIIETAFINLTTAFDELGVSSTIQFINDDTMFSFAKDGKTYNVNPNLLREEHLNSSDDMVVMLKNIIADGALLSDEVLNETTFIMHPKSTISDRPVTRATPTEDATNNNNPVDTIQQEEVNDVAEEEIPNTYVDIGDMDFYDDEDLPNDDTPSEYDLDDDSYLTPTSKSEIEVSNDMKHIAESIPQFDNTEYINIRQANAAKNVAMKKLADMNQHGDYNIVVIGEKNKFRLEVVPITDLRAMTNNDSIVKSMGTEIMSTSFIPELNIDTQQQLIVNIANDVFDKLVVNNKAIDIGRFITDKYKKRFDVNAKVSKERADSNPTLNSPERAAHIQFQAIVNNWDQLIDMVKVHLHSKNIVQVRHNSNIVGSLNTDVGEQDDSDIQDKNADITDSQEVSRYYSDASIELDYKDSANAKAKRLLMGISDVNYNPNDGTHRPKTFRLLGKNATRKLEYEHVYSSIMSVLSDEITDINGMIKRLEDNYTRHQFFISVVERLKTAIENKDSVTYNGFFIAMSKSRTEMIYAASIEREDSNSMYVSSTNKFSDTNVLLAQWEEAFRASDFVDVMDDDIEALKLHTEAFKQHLETFTSGHFDAIIANGSNIQYINDTNTLVALFNSFKALYNTSNQLSIETLFADKINILANTDINKVPAKEQKALIKNAFSNIDEAGMDSFIKNSIREFFHPMNIALQDGTINTIGNSKKLTKLYLGSENVFYKANGRGFAKMLSDKNVGLELETHPLASVYSQMLGLANIDKMFNNLAIADTYRDQANKLIYSYSMYRFIQTRANKMFKDKDLLNELKEFAFGYEATIIKDFLNKDGISFNEFKLELADAIVNRNILDGGEKVNESSLADVEWFKYISWMNQGYNVGNRQYGKFMYNTMSDGSSLYMTTYEKLSHRLKFDETDRLSHDSMLQVFDRVVMPEITKMKLLQESEDTIDLQDYMKASKVFILNPYLNNVKDLAMIPETDRIDFRGKTGEENIRKLQVEFANSLDTLVAENDKRWAKYGILKTDKDGDVDLGSYDSKFKTNFTANKDNNAKEGKKFNKKQVSTAYTIDYLIANMTNNLLFIGDPASYWSKNPIATVLNVSKRLAGDRAPGEIDSDFFKDTEFVQAYTNDIVVESLSKDAIKSLDNSKDGNDSAFDYTGIESTDGQELTSMYEDLRNRVSAGDINISLFDELYSTKEGNEGIIYKELKKGNYYYDSVVREELKGKDLHEYINYVGQPQKPVYVDNRTIDSKNGDFKVSARVYIKSSSFGLNPMLTANTDLDSLRQALDLGTLNVLKDIAAGNDGSTVKRVDRIGFRTANKAGMVNMPEKDKDGNRIEMDLASDPSKLLDDLYQHHQVLGRGGFKIQQKLPYNPTKSKTIRGTQTGKLAFVNQLHIPAVAKLKQEYDEAYDALFKYKSDELRKELTNETGQISVTKLYDTFIKEAHSRKFNRDEIEQLQLRDDYDFEQPLFYHTRGESLEGMLTSIVTNRILKTKFPGMSMILGTPFGFTNKKAKAVSFDDDNYKHYIKHGITYTDKWEGELKPRGFRKMSGDTRSNNDPYVSIKDVETVDGNLPSDVYYQPEQLIVPWKIHTNDGKRLNLQDYVEVVQYEDGTTKRMLKVDMLDNDVLTAFGFRIPTSGPNLNASMEIVGFTDTSAGDLVIASPDLIKQMGSDFDIDKLYAYMYKLDVTTTVSEEGTKSLSIAKNNDNEYEHIHKIIDIHHKLQQIPNVDVQRQIVSALSYGFFKDDYNPSDARVKEYYDKNVDGMLPELIGGLYDAGEVDTKQYPLSHLYQSDFYANGNVGKLGIASFSLASVFNAYMQGATDTVSLMDTFTKKGVTTTTKEKIIKIGGAEFRGSSFANPMALDGTTFKSKIIEWYQSTAVDNAKLNKMSMLNINEHTIEVVNLMNQMGFGEEVMWFINQPSIREYITNKDAENSNMSASKSRMSKAYSKTLATFEHGSVRKAIGEKASIKETYSSFRNSIGNLFDNIRYYNANKNSLTSRRTPVEGEDVATSTKTLGDDRLDFYGTQLAILDEYRDLESLANQFKQIIVAMNIDAKGIGKDISDNANKWSRLDSILKNYGDTFNNIESVLGDVVETSTDDSMMIGGKHIEAKGIIGSALKHSIHMARDLYKDMYPQYSDEYDSFVSNVLENSHMNRDASTISTISKDVNRAIKRSANSYAISKYVDVEKTFKNLVIDNPSIGNDGNSLATTIVRMVRDKNWARTNPFIAALLPKPATNVSKFSTVGFNNVGTVNNMNDLARGIKDLLEANPLIEIRKDGDYHARDLFNDLIVYSYVTGGVQSFNEFIRLIPYSYKRLLNIPTHLTNFHNGVKDMLSGDFEFYRQFVQHNPKYSYGVDVKNDGADLMKQVDGKNSKVSDPKTATHLSVSVEYKHSNGNAIATSKEGDEQKLKRFIHYRSKRDMYLFELAVNEDGIVVKDDAGRAIYRRISVLGSGVISEYDYNRVDVEAKVSAKRNAVASGVIEDFTIGEDVDVLTEAIYGDNNHRNVLERVSRNTTNHFNGYIANMLAGSNSYMDYELLSTKDADKMFSAKIKEDSSDDAYKAFRKAVNNSSAFVYKSNVRGVPNFIAYNEQHHNELGEISHDLVYKDIVHEYSHVFLNDSVQQGKKDLDNGQDTYAAGFYKGIVGLREESEAIVRKRKGDAFVDEILRKLKKGEGLNADEKMFEGLANEYEFVAEMLANRDFVNYLGDNQSRVDVSNGKLKILAKFVKLVANVFKRLGVNIKAGSTSHKALSLILTQGHNTSNIKDSQYYLQMLNIRAREERRKGNAKAAEKTKAEIEKLEDNKAAETTKPRKGLDAKAKKELDDLFGDESLSDDIDMFETAQQLLNDDRIKYACKK